MYAFSCDECGQLVFFDNTACVRCGSLLAFDPAIKDVVVVDDPARRCRNAELIRCNWLVATPGDRCDSCVLTRTRPADDDADGVAAWAEAETAKRRMVFQLLALGLRVEPRDEQAGTGVAFDLLASDRSPVTTGHAGGVITLDLAEVDPAHRARIQQKLGEPYRTVLGHFRHEIGHALFRVLVTDDDLAEARELFGDDTTDYRAALERHYRDGPPDGWKQGFVSAYATMHPAEDWAETFAHYLHLRGVLQTAAAYRVQVHGPDLTEAAEGEDGPFASTPADLDEDTAELDELVATWLPLSYALNAISRSIGEGELYPFVLRAAVVAKLRFIHRVTRQAAGR